MKLFVAVLCLAAVSSAYVLKTEDDLNAARRTCVGKNNITPARIGEYRSRVFRETDPETPPYVQCVFETLGLWGDGGFITDNYLTQLAKGDGAREGVVGCYDTTGTEPTIKTFRTFLCFLEKGLLPAGY